MGSHYACLGFDVEGRGDLDATLAGLLEHAVLENGQGEARHLRWTDPSGASVAFHLDGDRVTCRTPFFEPAGGLCRWQVATSRPSDQEGCAHCGGADCEVRAYGEMVTAAAIQWLHYRPYREWLEQERAYELEVVAFADDLAVFRNEDVFREMLPWYCDGLPLSPEGFIPLGMFGKATHEFAATALFAGAVTSAEMPCNSRGGRFRRVRVATLPGVIDVLAPAEPMSDVPPPGAIALVRAWLVGRPVPVTPGPAIAAS